MNILDKINCLIIGASFGLFFFNLFHGMGNRKINAFSFACIIVSIIVILSGCTNKEHAFRALESMDYDEIEYIGYKFFAYSKEDFYHTGFEAITKEGRHVTGTVCSGLIFRNSTVRFD